MAEGSGQLVQLDAESAQAIIMSITEDIANLQRLNNEFLSFVEAAEQETLGKNATINEIKKAVQRESENIKRVIETQDQIAEQVSIYAQRVAEADDTSDIRALMSDD